MSRTKEYYHDDLYRMSMEYEISQKGLNDIEWRKLDKTNKQDNDSSIFRKTHRKMYQTNW